MPSTPTPLKLIASREIQRNIWVTQMKVEEKGTHLLLLRFLSFYEAKSGSWAGSLVTSDNEDNLWQMGIERVFTL